MNVNKRSGVSSSLGGDGAELALATDIQKPAGALPELSAQIRRALARWRESLINLDGRNRLIYFNPSRTTKSYVTFFETAPNEFPKFDSQIIKNWLNKESIKASKLHAHEYAEYENLLKELKKNKDLLPGQVQRELEKSDWAKLLKSYKLIYEKQKENFDERNIETCFLAIDLLTWNRPDSGPDPRAPLVLIPLTVKPRGRGKSDFDILITGDPQINDVLTTFLKSQFDISVSELSPDTPIEQLRSHFNQARLQLPEGKIHKSWTITNFSFLQMPMVKDIQRIEVRVGEGEELSSILQALAGEEPDSGINPDFDDSDIWRVLEDSAKTEFLVFPTDQSQHRAIAAAVKGHSLVIQGPPGTGKSQTIANCVAELTARGKRVLFVAEKRAAIDAVVVRLREKALDSLVLDLHGEPAKKTIASKLLELLNSKNEFTRITERTRNELDIARLALQKRWETLNRPLPPDFAQDGVSNLYELLVLTGQAQATEPSEAPFPLAGRTKELIQLGLEVANDLGNELQNLKNLGWLDSSAGYSAIQPLINSFTTLAEADKFNAALQNLSDSWSNFVQDAGRWASSDGAGAESLKEILAELEVATEILSLGKEWDFDLLVLCYEEEPFLTKEKYAKEHQEENFMSRFFGWRRLDRRYRQAYLGPDTLDKEGQRERLARLMSLFAKRKQASKKRKLLPLKLNQELSDSFKKMRALTNGLSRYPAPVKSVFALPLETAQSLLKSLLLQKALVQNLPRIKGVRDAIAAKGEIAADLLAFFEDEEPKELALQAWLNRVYLETLLHETLASESFSSFQDSRELDELIFKLQTSDDKHLRDNPRRVKQEVLQRFEIGPAQHVAAGFGLLTRESAKKTQQLPFRKLMEQASDSIFALKPCFAMSPLNVSRLLPCLPELFDVVIFDEASQVRPEDSIPSIYRAKQVVVAGDRYQLAPTDAFRRDVDDLDETEDEETVAPATSGIESILDAMRGILLGASTFPLANHYRSKHEKLISFSNKTVYTPENQPLLTFPAAFSPTHSVLRYEYVENVRTSGIEEPNTREIDAVMQAIRRHIEQRPEKSLGVIAFGSRHAERLGDALARAEAEDDEVYAFIKRHEETTEPLFIKNIERVQGDERDYVIISPGYAPRLDGKVALRFGSLNNDGGERRINVAASRAKEGMHLITSLKASDLDLQRSQAKGVVSLRRFLEFMESGGTVAFEAGEPRPETPFEDSIYSRLKKEGLDLECQLGDSGFRIDFAVRHPKTPDAFILAIEADGASYHSSRYARERDALRQQILETRGWKFVRIWSTDWFRNPQGQIDKVLNAYKKALVASEFETSSNEHTPNAEAAVTGRGRIHDGEPRTNIAEQFFLAARNQYPTMSKDSLYEKWLELCGYNHSTRRLRYQFEGFFKKDTT